MGDETFLIGCSIEVQKEKTKKMINVREIKVAEMVRVGKKEEKKVVRE